MSDVLVFRTNDFKPRASQHFLLYRRFRLKLIFFCRFERRDALYDVLDYVFELQLLLAKVVGSSVYLKNRIRVVLTDNELKLRFLIVPISCRSGVNFLVIVRNALEIGQASLGSDFFGFLGLMPRCVYCQTCSGFSLSWFDQGILVFVRLHRKLFLQLIFRILLIVHAGTQ